MAEATNNSASESSTRRGKEMFGAKPELILVLYEIFSFLLFFFLSGFLFYLLHLRLITLGTNLAFVLLGVGQ